MHGPYLKQTSTTIMSKFVVPVSSLLGVQACSLLNLRLSFQVLDASKHLYTHMRNTLLLVTINFIHYSYIIGNH